MTSTKCIAAFTPSTDYKHYPPFINFYWVDDKVRVTVRGHEKLDGEHPQSGDQVVMDMLPEDFTKLISETAFNIIRNSTIVGEEG